MYLPDHFVEDDEATLAALIAAFPLGALVTYGPDGLTANHIPFLLERDENPSNLRLVADVARNNSVWHGSDPKIEPMVIFQGSSAYITPSWYQTKRDTHKVVPTYNYAVVHVHGPLVVHDEPKWTRMAIGKLTQRMERSFAEPWKMGDAPQDFLNEQIAHIVGIEIPVRRMVGKWKASQNRIAADRQGAANGLQEIGTDDANAMAGSILER